MFIFFIFLFVLYFLFNLSTIPFSNPYTLTMIFGKKGSGKTTLMTKLAYKYHRAGWEIYSNTPLPHARLIKEGDVGHRLIPPRSVLLIDEVGMIWDNRDFKKFDPRVRDWFKLQRHYRVKVFLFSQTFDIDKKLRDLTDEMYLVEKKFRIFSYGKRIMKKIVLTEASSEQPSRIDENLRFDSVLFFWAGSRMLTLIPRWTDSFDSFAAPNLPAISYTFKEVQFIPTPYYRVALYLLGNLYDVLCLDKLFSYLKNVRNRFEKQSSITSEQEKSIELSEDQNIDFEEFFSTPVEADNPFPPKAG